MNMQIGKKKSYHLLLFFLQPFLTLIFYLVNFKKPHAKNVMWLFTVFYGATFAISQESQESDIVHYLEDIQILSKMNLNAQIALEYFLSIGELDVLRTILSVTVSYFTNNGYYLIIIFSLIFGYFFSRNMWYVLDRLEGKTKRFTRLLILCLFLTIPIWFINGFRFWTAAHMFLFGLLPYLLEGKKRSLIWCFITPFLLHFSYLVPLVPLCIYLLLGNRIRYYFFFFIITLFVNNINVTQINEFMTNNVPEILNERSNAYTNFDKVEEFRNEKLGKSNTVWYNEYYSKFLTWVLLLFLIRIYLFHSSYFLIKNNIKYLRLLSFIFLLGGFNHMLLTLPSLGRFLYLSNILALIFLMLIMQNSTITKSLKYLSTFTTPFLIFFVIISLRLSFYSFSITTIFGNPIVAILTFSENLALNDIIKGHY